jgi:uncharacterized membrane protein
MIIRGWYVIWEKNRINNIKNWCGTINNKIKTRTERSFRKKKAEKKKKENWRYAKSVIFSLIIQNCTLKMIEEHINSKP